MRVLCHGVGAWAMEDHLSKAQHYRDQAAHMRELAAKDHNGETRNALISLAENYDRLSLKYFILAERQPLGGP